MPLSEEQRFPLIDAAGRRLLQQLHEHPCAPRFNHHCGDRLDTAGLLAVSNFAQLVESEPPRWQFGAQPGWLDKYVAFCLQQVPFYRAYGPVHDFIEIPPMRRVDLSRASWEFVPDEQNLDDLILYATSGTTGHPLDILSHPNVSSQYLPLLQAALKTRSISITGGSGRVAVIQICFQKRTFTFATLSSFLGHAGNLKLNLNPADWRSPDDRVRFLDYCDTEIYTGDPISFTELARLPLHAQPKALISTSMALLPGQQDWLEHRFRCPVLDIYSMNETGPLAVGLENPVPDTPALPLVYSLLQPRLYVEILDADGQVCPPGQRGEVTVTGGMNPFLPLLRYRTGDQASLADPDGNGQVCLAGLEGRPPTLYRGTSGQLINNIDITAVLRRFALSRFALHQSADGNLHLRLTHSGNQVYEIRQAIASLFGPGLELDVTPLDADSEKVIQYTSDITF